jgi:hypothetical protein
MQFTIRSRAFALLLLSSVSLRQAAAEDARPTPLNAETTLPKEPAAADSADSGGATAAAAGADDKEGSATQQLRKIEDELAQVMDELVSARARAGVLAQALFRTALEVDVIRRSDDARLEHITLRLDGVPIHDSDGQALASDSASLFKGYVAPGMHELAIELTERAKESAEFGYVRSERYRIDVKNRRRTRVELIVRDDSDMAEEVAEGDDGTYQVSTELRVLYGKASD